MKEEITSMPVFLCSDTAGQPKCPLDPFFIVPDKCKCVDYQVSLSNLWSLVYCYKYVYLQMP